MEITAINSNDDTTITISGQPLYKDAYLYLEFRDTHMEFFLGSTDTSDYTPRQFNYFLENSSEKPIVATILSDIDFSKTTPLIPYSEFNAASSQNGGSPPSEPVTPPPQTPPSEEPIVPVIPQPGPPGGGLPGTPPPPVTPPPGGGGLPGLPGGGLSPPSGGTPGGGGTIPILPFSAGGGQTYSPTGFSESSESSESSNIGFKNKKVNLGTPLKDGSYIIYLLEYGWFKATRSGNPATVIDQHSIKKYTHFVTREVETCIYNKPLINDVCDNSNSQEIKSRAYTHYLVEGADMNFRNARFNKADEMIDYALEICKYDDCNCTKPRKCN